MISQSSDLKLKKLSSRKLFNAITPCPNKGKKTLGDFAVFDIESNEWKEFVIGGIYDGKTFTTYDTLKKLCNALDKFKDHKIFAHFGGIFDFLFLINQWGVDNVLSSDLIMRGSSIFSFSRGSNMFYDSSGIMPFSLDKAARAYGVSHQKLEIDHSIKKTITPELIKYLKHDCVALYDCIKAFYSTPILDGVNFKPTLASQSLELMRKYINKSIPSINNKATDDFIREGYAGGRVEIFKPYYNNPDKPLYYYDFTSLYPSVMLNMDVVGSVKRVSKNITPHSFTDCEVESPENIFLPLLWKKLNNKFLFPRGKFRGIFTGLELLEAEKYGYKINRVYKSYEFNNLGKIFTPYIENLYKLKDEATNPVHRMTAKLLLNAGYGRIGIKRDRETLCIDDGSVGLSPTDIFIGDYRLAKKSNYFEGFSNPAIAAMVTAHARIKLYRAMEPIQESVYYCDTDSIVTSTELPASGKIGELKLEGTANQACFLLPKTYIFGDEKKMKGFPKEFAQSLNFQDFTIAMEGDLRNMRTTLKGKLARIKSTKNNNNSILKVLNSSDRQLKATYDKRILFKENDGWNSRPINYNEYAKNLEAKMIHAMLNNLDIDDLVIKGL